MMHDLALASVTRLEEVREKSQRNEVCRIHNAWIWISTQRMLTFDL